MISLLLVVKVTAILILASAAYLSCPRLPAALRHALCVFTLALICLAPFSSMLATVRVPIVFHAVGLASRPAALTKAAPPLSLYMVWLAGSILVLVRFLFGVGYLLFKSQSKRQTSNVASGVRVRLAGVSTPMLWGWIRPLILLPEAAAEWPEDRRELAIRHELTHLRRFDNWSSLLVLAARALYWFHPLVWWISSKLLIEQELACDERMLASGASATHYAEFLVDLSRNLSSPALFGCAMVSHPHQLRGRIKKILENRPRADSSTGSRFAFALFAVVLVSTALLAPVRAGNKGGATKQDSGVYKIGGDVLPPRVLEKKEPEYTRDAVKRKIQGTVVLSIVIASDGLPENIRVRRSLDPGLDNNAVESVRQYRFAPATKNGEPVAVEATVEVNFRMLPERPGEHK
jgi:TonB family protein